MVKVSAIVPVYNPGDNIDECIESLLGQSLPSAEYEVIFVDDGSSDGTPARLDALAAMHSHVRVEHIPPSGWPGKPRNVGIGLARGEFVYFVDNDDHVGAEALERLYSRAVADDADVVVGKVVGQGKFVPRLLFEEDRAGLTLEWPPLLSLLSPHKLFRRSLLDSHGVRFPEGRRRLEDHLFTMHAYFHARRVSVLAGYPCYYWVLRGEAGSGASYRAFDPKPYYDDVREVLDLVEEHTSPGSLRERLLAHWYRGKMLGRVGGTWFVNRTPEVREAFHAEIARLTEERFGPWVDEWLPANMRVRSQLLRELGLDALAALAGWEADLHASVEVGEARGEPGGGSFVIPFSAQLLPALEFSRGGIWSPPEPVRAVVQGSALDMADALGNATARLTIRSLSDSAEFVLPGSVRVEEVPCGGGPFTPLLRGEAVLEGGAPARAGRWEVLGSVNVCGFNAVGRARSARTHAAYEISIDAAGAVTGHGSAGVSSAVKGRLARRLPGMARAFRRAQRRRAATGAS
jgi:glycosyltransferase involved in cell wall biosynthesis